MPRGSEQIGHLIDSGITSFTLLRETLGKLATTNLALLLECHEIRNTDAAIATDAVRNDLASIQEFVEVCAAHSKALGGLCWRQRDGGCVNNSKIHAFADAATHAEQHVSQLRPGGVLGELCESLELVNGDARSLNGLHHGTHHVCRN